MLTLPPKRVESFVRGRGRVGWRLLVGWHKRGRGNDGTQITCLARIAWPHLVRRTSRICRPSRRTTASRRRSDTGSTRSAHGARSSLQSSPYDRLRYFRVSPDLGRSRPGSMRQFRRLSRPTRTNGVAESTRDDFDAGHRCSDILRPCSLRHMHSVASRALHSRNRLGDSCRKDLPLFGNPNARSGLTEPDHTHRSERRRDPRQRARARMLAVYRP